MNTDYDNPRVAGFGTATADDPPLPAQQHLDATDGEKVAPILNVQEQSTGRGHQVRADGSHADDDDGGDNDLYGSPQEAVEDRAYGTKGVTVDHLKDEIRARNEEREDESAHISLEGKKGDLIKALQDDDAATDAAAG